MAWAITGVIRITILIAITLTIQITDTPLTIIMEVRNLRGLTMENVLRGIQRLSLLPNDQRNEFLPIQVAPQMVAHVNHQTNIM